jgi:hypothetical protein
MRMKAQDAGLNARRYGCEARSEELGRWLLAVEGDDEESGDGSDEQRDYKPKDAAAILGLGKARVDQGQGSQPTK